MIIIKLAVMADRKTKCPISNIRTVWPEAQFELGTSLTSDGNLTRCTRHKIDYGCW